MKIRKTVILSAMLCLSLAVSYAESFIPSFIMGVKPGFANAVTLFVLYAYGTFSALAVSVIRCLISGFLFSGPISSVYGICGSLFAIAVMTLCKKARLSTVCTSSVGAVFHNFGQIICAAFFTKSSVVLLYLPYMTVFGIICGASVGILVFILKKPLSGFCDTSEISKPKLRDAAVPVLFAMLAAVAFIFLRSEGNTVKVTVGGKEYGRYRLDRDSEIEIKSEYGENLLVIKNGRAYIERADCKGGDCMHKMISGNGGEIVCLPHRLVIEIENDTADAVSG